MPFLPCILCGEKLEQRTDKNGKFYFTCDPCGTQHFIRRKQGIEKLEQLISELNKREIPFHTHAQHLYEVQAILSEIDGLKSEIDKLGVFLLDEDKLRIRKSLKTRIQGLLADLQTLAKRKNEIK